MLGKVQFELQKLVDSYRSHITQTIATPSESLLNELRTVEDMKHQCDEKRELYEHMLASQKEKGRAKILKETFASQELQTAQEEYDEEATLFVFRLKSLKQGQSHSLLTQAARHHSAQLSFFRKGMKSLETVEPHVKHIAEKHHIDYQFSGLEDYDTDGDDHEDGVNDSYDGNDDGELSFDYGDKEQGQDAVSTSRNSMELDQAEVSYSTISALQTTQENSDKNHPDFLASRRPQSESQSEPTSANKKQDPAGIKDMQPSSTKKFHTYVLPTPVDCKGSTTLHSTSPVSMLPMDGMGGWPTQLWHSSHAHSWSVLRENDISSDPVGLPPPLSEVLSLPPSRERWDHSSQLHVPVKSDPKKIKRQAYSGPLPSKAWSSKSTFSIASGQHQVSSPMSLHVSTPTSTSPKVSPGATPLMTSPKINELHELPRPPSASNLTRPYSLNRHSAPLASRGKEHSTAGIMATQLPTPPGAMSRSFSIPSIGQRMIINKGKLNQLIGPLHNQALAGEISPSHLAPNSLSNSQQESKALESILQAAKTKGA